MQDFKRPSLPYLLKVASMGSPSPHVIDVLRDVITMNVLYRTVRMYATTVLHYAGSCYCTVAL